MIQWSIEKKQKIFLLSINETETFNLITSTYDSFEINGKRTKKKC